jgi:hypothetical protein
MKALVTRFVQLCCQFSERMQYMTDEQAYLLPLGVSFFVTPLFGFTATLGIFLGVLVTAAMFELKYNGSQAWSQYDSDELWQVLKHAALIVVAGVVFQAVSVFFGNGTFHISGRFGFSHSWIVYSLLGYALGACTQAFLRPDSLSGICEELGIDVPFAIASMCRAKPKTGKEAASPESPPQPSPPVGPDKE